MLRKFVATGIVFVAGYLIGVRLGFRAAVADYVKNDGKKLENAAADIYPSLDAGVRSVPNEVCELVDEVESESTPDGRENANDESKGFQ